MSAVLEGVSATATPSTSAPLTAGTELPPTMPPPPPPKPPDLVPPLPALTRGKRARLWFGTMVLDHAFFRFWLNRPRRVGPELYRSSHPMPYQLRAAKRAGVASVLNLRGVDDRIASNVLERAECARLGLPMVHFTFYSRAAPGRAEVLGFAKLLESMPKPILMHCKSGADRAGLGSAMYLLLRENATPERAMQELRFWPYGHVKHAKTGVLDHFLDTYRRHHAQHGTSFIDWVHRYYDRKAVIHSFHIPRATSWLVDKVLRRE